MKTYKLTFLLFLMTCSYFYGQKKTPPKSTTYYSYDSISESVKPRGCIKAKSAILTDNKKDSSSTTTKSANIKYEFIKTAVKLIVTNISKLVYKPTKFAKSQSSKLKFITLKKDSIPQFNYSIDTLNNKNFRYVNYCKNRKDSVINLALNFSLHKLENKTNFKILKFNNFKYNFTSVKLKNKHHKVNLIIEITVKSFNKKGELYEYTIDPIQIKNAVPRGESSKVIPIIDDVLRYIPIENKIESISIIVNEVNTKKKTWDKWLEIFNDNKDKIQSTVIEQINGEEEE